MKRRCVVLFSGGLDSRLAVKILQAEGVQVEGLNFHTLLTHGHAVAQQAAELLGISLTTLEPRSDYFETLRKPLFGFGKGANPCIDCRIHMLKRAHEHLQRVGADFLATGEVLGQRPKSQKRQDLAIIAHHAAPDDLLLRPLSAKLLATTHPERVGWVNRDHLYAFSGQSRQALLELAQHFAIAEIPASFTCCSLKDENFGRKVFDLYAHQPTLQLLDWKTLAWGRHFRFDAHTKVIVGRNAEENQQLQEIFHAYGTWWMLMPGDFLGPTALLNRVPDEQVIDFAATLIARYAKVPLNGKTFNLLHAAEKRNVSPCEHPLALVAQPIAAQI